MPQNVLITGTGRPYALGFNLVRRYLENGDCVFASVRRTSEALETLKGQYDGRLHILTMDISSTESVNAAAAEAEKLTSHLDLVINNATTASADTMKELPDFNLDLIAPAVDVGAVGPIRVLKAFLPLLKKSEIGALVVNISSEAGSIGKCYRNYYLDYGTEKAALNMLTMTMHNYFRNDPNLNIICLHPGWMRTNPGNTEAPLDPYEQGRPGLYHPYRRTLSLVKASGSAGVKRLRTNTIQSSCFQGIESAAPGLVTAIAAARLACRIQSASGRPSVRPATK